MPLIYSGKLEAKRLGEFEGRHFASLDFLDRDRSGGLQVTRIYLPDGYDHSGFHVGQDIDVPVVVSVNKAGKLSFRLYDEASEGKPRSRPNGTHPNAPGQR
jgi:hypothetical protein